MIKANNRQNYERLHKLIDRSAVINHLARVKRESLMGLAVHSPEGGRQYRDDTSELTPVPDGYISRVPHLMNHELPRTPPPVPQLKDHNTPEHRLIKRLRAAGADLNMMTQTQ